MSGHGHGGEHGHVEHGHSHGGEACSGHGEEVEHAAGHGHGASQVAEMPECEESVNTEKVFLFAPLCVIDNAFVLFLRLCALYQVEKLIRDAIPNIEHMVCKEIRLLGIIVELNLFDDRN